MGRRSYTPSPPRGGYGRRRRSPSPRGRYGGGGGSRGRDFGRDLPTSLLVRNLRLDCRPEDLRRPFGQFGPLKDVYLPRDYYSGEPRGFGFVQFVEPADAAEAKYQMDGQVFQGRELTVVFAEENRKKPADMRQRERRSGSRYNDRRRSPPPRIARSPPPRYARSRSNSRDYSPPPKRRHHSRNSRSISPRGKRYSRERSYSQSPRVRDGSPPYNGGSRSRSRSPIGDRSPPSYNDGSRSPPQSPQGANLSPRDPSRSRSITPDDDRNYSRPKPNRDDASVSP